MAIVYNGLWKILVERKMKKEDLMKALNISASTISRMEKGEPISTRVIEKICAYLDCSIGDIMNYENSKS